MACWKQLGRVVMVAVCAIAVTAWGVIWQIGLARAAVAYLRGEAFVLDADVRSLGEGRVGAEQAVDVRVRNTSGDKLVLTGASAQCSCLKVSGLPVDVAAGETISVRAKYHFFGDPGERTQLLTIYSNSRITPERTLVVRATVTP